MTEATAARDQALNEVKAAHAAAIVEGLAVLERWARTGEPFSANDVRDELRTVGVSRASTGALFGSAIRAGTLTRVGYVRSTDVGTHAKPVMLYVGGTGPLSTDRPHPERVTVPVVRDRGGRFAQPRPDDAPTLFEVSA